jgi:hypothetical protein
MLEPGLPEGAVRLTVDEAVNAVLLSDHPEGDAGSVEIDTALISMLRRGDVWAIRLSDGRLAFAPNPVHVA